MHFDPILTVETLGVIFGFGIAAARLWPQIAQFTIAFQMAFTMTQLINVYLKNMPHKRQETHRMFNQMTQHYLTTHPDGQKLVDNTHNLDAQLANGKESPSTISEPVG